MTRVALFGAGFVAGNHAVAYGSLPNAKLVAVVDSSVEKAKKLADQYGAKSYSDAEECLSREQVDMVDVCLPSFLHEQFSVMGAKHGKHVLCEKPFALTRKAGDTMIKAARDAKVTLMIAQVLRFWPEYMEIKKRLDAGELGDIVMVYANRMAQHPNWGDWFDDPNKSGGGLFDLHFHDIDIVRHYFGPAKTAYAVGYKAPTQCYNHVISSLVFKNGVKAVVEAGYQMSEGYPFTMTMRVVGTKATLEFVLSAGFNIENLGAASTRLVLFANGKKPEVLKVEQSDAYRNEIAYFIDCIENNKEPTIIPATESREVLDIVLALRASMESGKVQRL